MNLSEKNVDQNEIQKFHQTNSRWWDIDGPLKTLHVINPVRMQFISEHTTLKSKIICDVGCGGGILTEALAREASSVHGIDMNESAIQTAKLHGESQGIHNIKYHVTTSEDFADENTEKFDLVTCLEMLEHVPDPESIIRACAKLVKPGGKVFFSTLNRTAPAYLKAVLTAEYILNILPKGTHDYSKFIKPSELTQFCRKVGLETIAFKGLAYLPILDKAYLSNMLDTNYILCAEKTA